MIACEEEAWRDERPAIECASWEREAYCATVLRNAGYRVLAPFVGGARVIGGATTKDRVAAIIDVETTSLGEDAEIVQLAISRVRYDPAVDEISAIGAPWVALNQPSIPISAEALAVHGITEAMVAGHCIMEFDVAAQLEGVRLLVAHNAAFDAPIFARCFPALPRYAWACSMVDVPWPYESKRLGALLMDHTQQHFHAHDAGQDVAAVAEILATPFADGSSPFALLLANARAPRVRVLAERAPYEVKDALKARGYHWNATSKVWWIDTTDARAERDWLRGAIYPEYQPMLQPLTAMTRFL